MPNGGGVIVMGAGLTGASAALELARMGMRVTLLDRDERPMNRASLRNEGKIHLGFVFSQDLTGASSQLQLHGALQFRRLLARWIGERADALQRSSPFVYLVPRDSIATHAELAMRFEKLDAAYRRKLAGDPDADYLGMRPSGLFAPVPLSAIQAHIRTERFAGAFATAEQAIDTQELADVITTAIVQHPNIDFQPHRTVVSVERRNGRFRVEGSSPEGSWHFEAGQVVNALWEQRMMIDRTIGLEPDRGWLHRLKYRVIARLPDRLRGGPSATLVVGPYGDVVVRPNGTAYFSWYPLGLQGWSEDVAPPEEWNAPCRGELTEHDRHSIAAALLSAIDEWYPGAAQATPLMVDAGAIVAYGRTDVGDIRSGLHERSTHVGVTSMDGYHSVDPGKLTTCPLFGVEAARAVAALPAPA